MDSMGGGLGNLDLSKLSDRDKQELQQFVMNEGQKARIQSCTSLNIPSQATQVQESGTNTSSFRSDTLAHRYLFPQMHPRGQRQERQIGQVRGAVYEAVCGSVLGCEYGCAEGVGEAEAIDWHAEREREVWAYNGREAKAVYDMGGVW
jgi:hypothetical protein